MDGNTDLSLRQLRTIPYLIAAPSIEEGCKRSKVSKATVYAWLKEAAFKEELRRQRNEISKAALERMKAGMARATDTLLKHLDSPRENISLRAAESILAFSQKALEHEEIEKRIEALEANLSQQKENHR